jgi:hypothetical protein
LGERFSMLGFNPSSSSVDTWRAVAKSASRAPRRLQALGLVVRDHALGDADGLAELGLGEAAALAHLGEPGRFLGAGARDAPPL